ncbi:Laminarinase [Trichoderma simmonsii]|uniref:Laminarinase n=2 Tax=Trichoderma simmonsii TaxID=1491479 RepID=A0A8G0PKZ2_9HYPO|nr:Laminarinase [Trichoderma simmonsii]
MTRDRAVVVTSHQGIDCFFNTGSVSLSIPFCSILFDTLVSSHSFLAMLKSLAFAAALLGAVTASPTLARHEDRSLQPRANTSFWYAAMDHTGQYKGYAPHAPSPSSYNVFVAVNAGDAGSLQSAIDSAGSSNRQNEWLASQPRVVYIPPGTYTLSQTLNMRTDTILMGDATNPPIIKAAAGFSGNYLVNGQDPSTGVSGELSFAVGLKNLVLDTTAVSGTSSISALYWGVAQAAQLQNVKIVLAPSSGGKGHTGIQLGRGSTLGLADVRIENGQNGIWHNGHQQALYKSIYFYKNTIGMLISGGNTITLLNPTFDTCGTGISVTGGSPFVGIVDAKSINSGVTFTTTVYPSIVIDNLSKDTSSDVVVLRGTTALKSSSKIVNYSYGNTVGRSPIFGAVSGTPPPLPAGRGRIPAAAVNHKTPPTLSTSRIQAGTTAIPRRPTMIQLPSTRCSSLPLTMSRLYFSWNASSSTCGLFAWFG